VPTRYKPLP